MSNFLAVAQVTTALQSLLDAALQENVPGKVELAHAIVSRPDEPGLTADGANPRVTVYLYEVVPDPARRNDDLATRDSAGRAVRRPTAAVRARYLLTFFGSESQLQPHRMLGIAMRTLHERPLLTAGLLQAAATGAIAAADAAQQGEPVRLSPLSLSLEETTKLWSAFKDTPYRLSVAYEAGAILLDAGPEPPAPLPVDTVKVFPIPGRPPSIQAVRSAAGPQRPIAAGGGLVLEGSGLSSPHTQVRVGDVTYDNVAGTPQRLQVTLAGDALRAGVQPAQIVHVRGGGLPPVTSNVAAFVLHPSLAQVTVETLVAGRRLRATLAPPLAVSQRASLLLDEVAPPGPLDPDWKPRRHRLEAWQLVDPTPPVPDGPDEDSEPDADDGPPEAATQADFECPGVAAGSYLVRIEVDGAQSPVKYPGAPGGPDPVVVVP